MRKQIIRLAAPCLFLVALAGCTASQQTAGVALMSDVGPVVASVVNGVFPQVAPVLTIAAQIACAQQAAANAAGNPALSALAGLACIW